MPTLTVVDASTTYKMTEDGEFVCAHEDAYIEKACCSGFENGLPSCGCRGQDGVICPALDCEGIQDHEVDDLFEKLTPGEPDYD